jgi:hypothetical protein
LKSAAHTQHGDCQPRDRREEVRPTPSLVSGRASLFLTRTLVMYLSGSYATGLSPQPERDSYRRSYKKNVRLLHLSRRAHRPLNYFTRTGSGQLWGHLAAEMFMSAPCSDSLCHTSLHARRRRSSPLRAAVNYFLRTPEARNIDTILIASSLAAAAGDNKLRCKQLLV